MFLFYMIYVAMMKFHRNWGTYGFDHHGSQLLELDVEGRSYAVIFVVVWLYVFDFCYWLEDSCFPDTYQYLKHRLNDIFLVNFSVQLFITWLIVYLYFCRNNRYKRYFEKYKRMDSFTKCLYSLGGLVVLFLPPLLFLFCIYEST